MMFFAYIKKMSNKTTVLPFYLTLPYILVNVLKLFSFEIILKFSDKFHFYKICYSMSFAILFSKCNLPYIVLLKSPLIKKYLNTEIMLKSKLIFTHAIARHSWQRDISLISITLKLSIAQYIIYVGKLVSRSEIDIRGQKLVVNCFQICSIRGSIQL